MTPARALAATAEAFIAVLATQIAHRILAFGPLAGSLKLTTARGLNVFLSGSLSDIWIAFLIALCGLVADCLLALLGRPEFGLLTRLLLLLFVGATVTIDQAYAQAFHIQWSMGPFTDLVTYEFLATYAAELVSPASLGVVFVLAFVGVTLLRTDPFEEWSGRALAGLCAILAVLSFAAHDASVSMRGGWDAPESLRVNALDRLLGD